MEIKTNNFNITGANVGFTLVIPSSPFFLNTTNDKYFKIEFYLKFE